MKLLVILLLLSVTTLLFFHFIEGTNIVAAAGNYSVSDIMSSGDSLGFEKALTVRKFSFPDDHFPHDSFRTEWWYFTGHLKTGDGKSYGYQFTIFRTALIPVMPENTSDFTTTQLYSVHFTVSDFSEETFRFCEDFVRGDGSTGGFNKKKTEFNVNRNRLRILPGNDATGIADTFLIDAVNGDLKLSLRLVPAKKIVLHGDEGLSKKSYSEGNASYYYSYTEMNTAGTIITGGRVYEVNGRSWMDREWSTSALEKDQRGWDWFSIALEDGSELMLFKIRGQDNKSVSFSKGSYIDPAGNVKNLTASEIVITEISFEEMKSGHRYPSGWEIWVKGEDMKFRVKTLLKDQELLVSVPYYEGGISVSGKKRGSKIAGKGYAELTGYAN